jgi:hypothetical protein
LKNLLSGVNRGATLIWFLLGFEMTAPPSMAMTRTDYEKILSYYKVPFDKLSHHELQKKAEDILATKLCKCIKAVEKKVGTQNAIALCTASVFRKKGLKYFDMSCKGRSQLQSRKGRKLAKTRKNIMAVAVT